jgi:hypothetical protein
MVSAGLLAWLCGLAGWQNRSAVFWIALAPVLYVAWLAGAARLRAPHIEGSRNQPVKLFLIKSGFHLSEAGAYELELRSAPTLPEHIDFKVE